MKKRQKDMIDLLETYEMDFEAKYTRYFGLGEDRYEVYQEGLRRMNEEGEGELLLYVREGNVEGLLSILREKQLSNFHELVYIFVDVFLF